MTEMRVFNLNLKAAEKRLRGDTEHSTTGSRHEERILMRVQDVHVSLSGPQHVQ